MKVGLSRIHESQKPQSIGLRFRALLTEGDTQLLFYREGFDRLSKILA